MIDTTHEDRSGMSDMIEESYMRDTHHISRRRHDVQTIDLTLTYPHEEIESPLLETPLVDHAMEIDSWMGHLLPGLSCSDEDVPFIGQDDHKPCMDTSIWDPRADDSSRVSAQEDTTTHIGYHMIYREIAVGDDVQSHTGGTSSVMIPSQIFRLVSLTTTDLLWCRCLLSY
jgi:hypothetical protein